MLPNDKAEFLDVLEGAFAMYGQAPNKSQVFLFWELFADWTLAEFRAALTAHLRDAKRGQFFPKPADLMAQRVKIDGHPSPDEAWAIAVKGQDESATVFRTEPMASAFGVAWPILNTGDKVGARMAFLAAYERAVAHARANGQPAKWIPSWGTNADERKAALSAAVQQGLIGKQDAQALLPHYDDTSPTVSLGQLLLGTDAPKAESLTREQQQANWKALGDMLRSRPKAVDMDSARKAKASRSAYIAEQMAEWERRHG